MCRISLVEVGKDIKFLEGVESTFMAHLVSYQPQETAKTMAPSLRRSDAVLLRPLSLFIILGDFFYS